MWAAIGSFLLIVIGLWKWFSHKRVEKKARVDEAHKMHEEGIKDRDPRKIIGGNDRLNNDV